jgi:hypothetical protein
MSNCSYSNFLKLLAVFKTKHDGTTLTSPSAEKLLPGCGDDAVRYASPYILR